MSDEKRFEKVWEMSGQELLDDIDGVIEEAKKKAKEILKEGRNCRVVFEKSNGELIFKCTLTAGVLGATMALVLAPLALLITSVAAVITRCTLRVERVVKEATQDTPAPEGK